MLQRLRKVTDVRVVGKERRVTKNVRKVRDELLVNLLVREVEAGRKVGGG